MRPAAAATIATLSLFFFKLYLSQNRPVFRLEGQVGAQRRQVIVCDLGRAEEGHGADPIADEGCDHLRRKIRALFEQGGFLALVPGPQGLGAGHGRNTARDDVCWKLAVTGLATRLKYLL